MPLQIGVTATSAAEAQPYVDVLKRLGVEPHLLENDETRAASDVQRLDALLLTGGVDLAPEHFGEAPHAKTEASLPSRDGYELAITRFAWERDLPLLAICRGLQVMNVALGGTLIQHLPDVVDGEVHHNSGDEISDRHVVEVSTASQLARIARQRRFSTNSTHHQAIAKVADELAAVAHTADGIIEAAESKPQRRFWIGVQWHPELTFAQGDPVSEALFRAFIRAGC
jgi:putative glutamine amidotransferase